MAKMKWRERPEIVARLIDSGSIRSWNAKDIVLKPNEAVSIVANGKVQDTLSETTLANYVGGFGRWLGAKIGLGYSDHKLIFALTGPFDLLIPMKGRTMDGNLVTGLLTLRLQIVREDVPKLLNLFASGNRVIDRGQIVARFQNEILNRVIVPTLALTADGKMLRGPAFQEQIEARCRYEMRSAFGLAGLTLIKAFAAADQTDVERLAGYRAEIAAVNARKDAQSNGELGDIERARRATLARIEMENDISRALAQGEVDAQLEEELLELRKMEATLAAERDDAMARMQATLEDEKERRRLRAIHDQRRLSNALEAFDRIQAAKQNRLNHASDLAQNRQSISDKLQFDVLQLAADSGALEPAVVQTFLAMQTEQRSVEVNGISNSVQSAEKLNKICRECGGELEAGWNVCPTCTCLIDQPVD